MTRQLPLDPARRAMSRPPSVGDGGSLLEGEVVDLEAVSTDVLLRYLGFCRQASVRGRLGPNVYSIRDGRAAGYAPASINRRLVAISGLFAYRQMRDPSAPNPVPRGRETRRLARGERSALLGHLSRPRSKLRLRQPRRLPRGLDRDEVRSLLGSFRSNRDRAIAGLMLFSGLRSAEVLGLQVPGRGHGQGVAASDRQG